MKLFSEDEALSLTIESQLTKHQYMLIRREAKVRGANVYLPYRQVLNAKTRSYPDIQVSK